MVYTGQQRQAVNITSIAAMPGFIKACDASMQTDNRALVPWSRVGAKRRRTPHCLLCIINHETEDLVSTGPATSLLPSPTTMRRFACVKV